jgi:hypothetical protein
MTPSLGGKGALDNRGELKMTKTVDPRSSQFGREVGAATKQLFAEVGDNPERLSDLLCGAIMIVGTEIHAQCGADAARRALDDARAYLDKLNRSF